MPDKKYTVRVRVAPRQAARDAEEAGSALRDQGRGEIVSDVLGSYTGTPADGGRPIQDADDL